MIARLGQIGFHRKRWFEEWTVKDYLRPDEAVRLVGVSPEEVTDVVISHAHWDHMGGIDLFPKASVWIQQEEYRYYTGEAWQPRADHAANVAAQRRMVELTGAPDRIVPGHDALQFQRFPTEGRIARIR